MINLKTNENREHSSTIVVGGSPSGLVTSIAFSEQGIKVHLFEKSEEGARSGAGLQVDKRWSAI